MKVAIVYHIFPHYRRPILRELVKRGDHQYSFYASLDPVDGVKAFQGDELVSIKPIRFTRLGSTWILKDYWPILFDRSIDVIILHGHPNMPASWLIGLAGRVLGKRICYWAHGWLKRETFWKRAIRNAHYNLADKVLTYGDRAIAIAKESKFPIRKIVPIYNSLDWLKAEQTLNELLKEGRSAVRERLNLPTSHLLISCVARLTPLCRFDLLLQSASKLAKQNIDCSIVLIGDGPERESLRLMAEDLNLNVLFVGETYDEDLISSYIFASDVTVSPGKVGLTAMHSLMYGTPVVSHDNLDAQMPEVEAIVPGENGSLFAYGDHESLSKELEYWASRKPEREVVGEKCIEVIKDRYNPVTQAKTISDAISSLQH